MAASEAGGFDPDQFSPTEMRCGYLPPSLMSCPRELDLDQGSKAKNS